MLDLIFILFHKKYCQNIFKSLNYNYLNISNLNNGAK